MTRTLTKLRIFVASTGDLDDERKRLARVVDSLNKPGRRPESLGLTLELLRWETHVPPSAGRPQGHILEHLPPQDWDIFVGILWKRFGTRTGAADPSTGEDYLSGTEEEFKEALRRREAGGTRWPWIMFYRCGRLASPVTLDAEQLARVNDFFKECEPGGRHPALVFPYNEPADFERLVREHLEDVVNRYADDFLGRRGGGGRVTRGAGGIAPAPEWEVTMPGVFRYALDRLCPRLHSRLTTQIGWPEQPREWPVLHNYLSKLSARIEADIKVKTYVEPHAKAPPLEEVDRLEPRMIKEIIGVTHGGDAQSAQISAISKKSRFVSNLVGRLLKADEPFVLLGDPGTGKSITLQQAAMVIAERESRRIFPSVCVFVRLGEFRPAGEVTEESVWDYVKKATPPDVRPYLDSLDTSRRLIIFFDGMDEMSRERYDDYTRALSIFAEVRKVRGTRTLFSCRITDFTPRFQHRRLVLLPFGRRQIRDYLKRQLVNFPVTVGGRAWSARQLAKHLAGGGLPMQADNPFVLWLLCTYMLKEQDWPRSRVHLLEYYNRYNYERKAQDAARDGHSLPEMEAAFLTWGRLAYEITNRNQGAAISLRDEGLLLTPEEMSALEAAKQCGVIQKPREPGSDLVSFEHHRFQEYFTAFHLSRNPAVKATLNWLDKLDAPRWQETLFNLVLMGGGGEALAALKEAIALALTRLAEERDARPRDQPAEPSRGGRGKRPTPEAVPPEVALKDALAETLLADRVELASRVLQQTQPLSEATTSGLAETFRDAAYWLADHGNPITKVKMLLASKAVAGVDIYRVAREALASDVAWVRQQALIVTSVVRRAVGQDALQEDLSHNFASGRFLDRVSGYVRIASALRQRRLWVELSAVALLTLVQFFFGYGFVLGVHRGLPHAVDAATAADRRSLKKDYTHVFIPADEKGNVKKSEIIDRDYEELVATRERWVEVTTRARGTLESRGFFLFVSGAYLLIFMYTVRRLPGRQSLTSLSAGLGLLFLPYILWALWLGHWPQLVLAIFSICAVAPSLLLAGWALMLLAYTLTLMPLAAAPQREGFTPRLRTMCEAMWENCGFRAWADSKAFYVGILIACGYTPLALIIFNRDSLAAFIAAYGLFQRFPPVVNAVLSAATVYAVGVVLPATLFLWFVMKPSWLHRALKKFVVWSASSCVAVPGGALIVWGLTFADWEQVRQFALAVSLFPFFPADVNVTLSGTLYVASFTAALWRVLQFWSWGEVSGRRLFFVSTGTCVLFSAVILLTWGIISVNWNVVWAFVASTFGLFKSLPPPLNAAFSLAICAEGVGILVSPVYGLGRAGERRVSGLRFLRNWTLACLGFAVCGFLLWEIYLHSDFFARILAGVIVIILAGLLLISLGGALGPVVDMLRVRIRRDSYSTEVWKATLAGYDPARQAALLRWTTPEEVGLDVGDFLALLQSVEGVIKKDPAQSAYWAKRQQIEQIIRQERIG